MGLVKEGLYAGGGIIIGVGINEVIKTVELTAPGTSQPVIEALKTLPVISPAISWAGLRVLGPAVNAIFGNKPPTGPVRDRISYRELNKKRISEGKEPV